VVGGGGNGSTGGIAMELEVLLRGYAGPGMVITIASAWTALESTGYLVGLAHRSAIGGGGWVLRMSRRIGG
jgi:hypothetical protein